MPSSWDDSVGFVRLALELPRLVRPKEHADGIPHEAPVPSPLEIGRAIDLDLNRPAPLKRTGRSTSATFCRCYLAHALMLNLRMRTAKRALEIYFM